MDMTPTAGTTTPPARTKTTPPSGTSVTVVVQPEGWRFVAQADQTLLMAAQAAGIRLASSCRNGTCRRCLCGLVSGDVEYRIPWPGISRDEREDGWVLPCVAHPLTDVVIETPEAERMAEDPVAARVSLTGARR